MSEEIRDCVSEAEGTADIHRMHLWSGLQANALASSCCVLWMAAILFLENCYHR